MTENDNERDRSLAAQFINNNDPTGWFEQLYAHAAGNTEQIPWENGQPHPTFLRWKEQSNFQAKAGERALVVACGLGNDAEELSRMGFTVTAFDISATAIEWCQDRFPDSSVDYQVADLFSPPIQWAAAFDFVLDIFTIQALPPEMHPATTEAIARFVAPSGRLFTSYFGRDVQEIPSGPPWPLAKAELDLFKSFGLTEQSFEDYRDAEDMRRFVALYANV